MEEAAAPVASFALRAVSGLERNAGDDILRFRLLRAQEMPGFTITLPAGALAFDVGIETQALRTRYDVDGEHIPGIFGDDVRDQNVDLVGGVNDFAVTIDSVGGLNVIAASANDLGAFELHAPEARAGVENEVVAFAVAPGAGDVEAEAFGFE